MNNLKFEYFHPFQVVKAGDGWMIQKGLVFSVAHGVKYEVENATIDLRQEPGEIFTLEDGDTIYVDIETESRGPLSAWIQAEVESVVLTITSDTLVSDDIHKIVEIGNLDGEEFVQKISSDIYVALQGEAIPEGGVSE